jgi:polyisoprenoid-binding protein YceI
MLKNFLMVVFCLAVTTAISAEKYGEKAHKMTVDGTSTLHDWTTEVGKVKASADISVEGGELKEVKAVWIQVDVMSIKSEKGDDMDEKIQEALKVEDGHKTITYNLNKVIELTKSGSGYKIKAEGTMTIAGFKKNVTMVVDATVAQNGDVTFSGSQKILMSDYNMDRPSAMLGMIKAGNEVTVSFTVTVKKTA